MPGTQEQKIAKHPDAGFFGASSGQMGERIKNFDWSKSKLGPSDTWPQSLQSALSICLNSNFPIAIYWGPDLVLLYNDAWNPIPGNKHPWALGKPAREVWPDIWQDIEPQFEKAFNGIPGGSKDALLPMQRHGYTEECYFDFTFTPVYGESGKVEGIFNAVIETTYRVIAERRANVLQRLSDALNGNQTFEQVFHNAKSILDASSQDVAFYCVIEIHENNEFRVRACSNELKIADTFSLNEIIASGSSVLLNDLDKYFNHIPSGYWPERTHEALLIHLKSNEGKVLGCVIGGISSRRGYEKDYHSFYESIGIILSGELNTIRSLDEERKRAEAFQALDKAKTAFFSNISHEFRTPLTLMLGPLEELLQDQSRPANEKTNLDATHRNAMRLLRLVNTLLDFSRLESGRIKAKYVPVRLGTLTRDLAATFQSAIENVGLLYEINVKEVHQPIFVDREMWEKIVLNLISNAFKYTLTGKITVSLVEHEGKTVLKVKDTGIGIPAHELPRMFERFHRVQNARGRTYEGSGIGLSLVQELVHQHGGKISVESAEGKGSIFTVEIPSGNAHLPQDQVSKELSDEYQSLLADIYVQEAVSLTRNVIQHSVGPTASQEDTTRLKRHKVLIVDDNADMREYISRLLDRTYQIESASNGMQALQKLAYFKADVILSDIMMPVMDGIQLLSTLKGKKSTSSIPVIFLSARAGEESRIEGYDIGADDYLIKPFSAKELLARIKAQISISKIRGHAESNLKNIFQQAPVILVTLKGPDFIIEIANEKLLEYWGKALDDIIDKPLLRAMPEIADQGLMELLSEVYHKGIRYTENERRVFLNRKGSKVETFVSFVYEPLKDENGSVIGITVVANDMTDAVNARRKIEASESKFRNLVLQAPVGIAILKGKDFKVEVANDAYLSIVDRSHDDFVNKPVLEALPEIKDTPILGYLNQVVDTGESFYGFDFPLVVNKKGERIKCYFNFVYQPFIEDNKTTGVIAVVIDITEVVNARNKAQNLAIELEEKVKERTAELTLANDRLEASNHDLEQFAYIASHDLQEPLRKIQTFSELLNRNLKNEEHVKKYIHKIDTSAGRMASLIKDVLNYSKLSKGNEQFSNVDLNEVLKNVEMDFELLISEKNATVNNGELPVIYGIPLQINQLFSNLISNSLKFSDQNTKIEVSARELSREDILAKKELNPSERFLELEFRDNGLGFEQQYAQKIFEIFQRLSYNTAYSGTGIGLALCKKIVDNHNGHIEAFSELGNGATFKISLPIRDHQNN